MQYVILALGAAGLALLLTPAVRALALGLDAIDEPGPRRAHVGRVPRLGGLAVLAAVLGTALGARAVGVDLPGTLAARGWHLGWLLAGLGTIVAAGVVDDVRGLRVRWKLALQVAAAAMALAGGYDLRGFTNPLTGGFIELGGLAAPLTILWIVAITNAFNLIDGLDGLATGIAVIASATLFAVALTEGRTEAALVWATLGGALAGFLVYNFNPASIFLGDSGSLSVGYLMSVLSIQSLQKGATVVVILVPVLALGLPIMDVVLALVRRWLGAGVGAVVLADREHIHHRLLQGGLSERAAVLLLYGVCLAFSVLAFLAVLVQGAGKALIVGVAASATYAGIRWLGYDVRARRPERAPPREVETTGDGAAGGTRPGAGSGR